MKVIKVESEIKIGKKNSNQKVEKIQDIVRIKLLQYLNNYCIGL